EALWEHFGRRDHSRDFAGTAESRGQCVDLADVHLDDPGGVTKPGVGRQCSVDDALVDAAEPPAARGDGASQVEIAPGQPLCGYHPSDMRRGARAETGGNGESDVEHAPSLRGGPAAHPASQFWSGWLTPLPGFGPMVTPARATRPAASMRMFNMYRPF